MNNFFCGLHYLVGLATVADSSLKVWDQLIVGERKVGAAALPGRGESKRHAIRALSEPYPLATIRASKMSELKVPISADKGSH